MYIENEYDQLKTCLAVYPANFDITVPINEMQKKNIGKINFSLANSQYHDLVNLLINEGVKVNFLDLTGSPYQVFTRDIGFAIKDILFIANMSKPIRKEETRVLLNYAGAQGYKIYKMNNQVEGGDIFVHNDKLFVGISSRTSEKAVKEIANYFADHNINIEVIPVLFDISRLHLDCVFNILDQDTCLLTEYVIDISDINKNFSKIIKISTREAESLAVNLFNLGNKKVVCASKYIDKILKDQQYNSFFINYSEFIKAGGSIRCSVLPLCRGLKV